MMININSKLDNEINYFQIYYHTISINFISRYGRMVKYQSGRKIHTEE